MRERGRKKCCLAESDVSFRKIIRWISLMLIEQRKMRMTDVSRTTLTLTRASTRLDFIFVKKRLMCDEQWPRKRSSVNRCWAWGRAEQIHRRIHPQDEAKGKLVFLFLQSLWLVSPCSTCVPGELLYFMNIVLNTFMNYSLTNEFFLVTRRTSHERVCHSSILFSFAWHSRSEQALAKLMLFNGSLIHCQVLLFEKRYSPKYSRRGVPHS